MASAEKFKAAKNNISNVDTAKKNASISRQAPNQITNSEIKKNNNVETSKNELKSTKKDENKYKAVSNGMNNDVEEKPKTQDEINTENNANTLLNAAEVASNVNHPVVKAIGTAVKLADKYTDGKSTQKLAEITTKANKVLPGGAIVQGASNKLSESGMGDKIGQAASTAAAANSKGSSSTGQGASKAANDAQKAANSNQQKKSNSNSTQKAKGTKSKSSSGGSWGSSESSSDNFSLPTQLLVFSLAIPVSLIFLLLLLFANPNKLNLDITNNENLSFTSNGTRTCTEEEIENKLIYVGDNRVNSINESISNDKISYITNDYANLNWFSNLGKSQLENELIENPDKVVVISLGLRDLENVDNYIEIYRGLIERYPNQIYISSINPVDESKTSSYSNIDIENFNKKLADNFPNNYIDTYSSINNLNSSDGIIYDIVLNQNIHIGLISFLKGSGNVSCSTGLNDIVYYNQNDYTGSYGYGTTIKSDGCGPVAMAMVLSTLKGESITPDETAKWSLENGYKTSAGTSVDFIPAVATHYGVKSETVSLEQESIINNLSQSKPIVMLVGPGIFTSRNHYIVLTGVSNDGKISLADPLSLEKSQQLWDINTIIGEGTGSLWAFSI